MAFPKPGSPVIVTDEIEMAMINDSNYRFVCALLSPDRKRLAYIKEQAMSPGSREVVVDGKADKAYHNAGWLLFSPDSKRVVFIVPTASEPYKKSIVIDGQQGLEYNDIKYEPIFSPDTQRVAYVATKERGKWFVVVDEVEGKPYDDIIEGTLTWDSPHARHYLARKENVILLVEEKITM